MSTPREVRSFEYVNRPYAQVRDAVKADPEGLVRHGASAAAGRADSLATTLRVGSGGLEVGVEVQVRLGSIEETAKSIDGGPVTVLHLEWSATRSPGLFPTMQADLRIYPLTATETQLEIQGRYQPPLGAVGQALDAALLHRIAEASVHRLVEDLAHHLRQPAPA